ncbi:sensor histidine kinase, partial [Arthrobacter sp. JCM 19049]|uniref:sensor histidine kinase n=1 Tax=Arthrobacter sp. JCM 19049 TaxID=1460643 RepID=UPI000AA184AC
TPWSGEVSVGLATESLTRTLLVSISWIILFALLAAVLATLVGRATVRRLKRETLGLEPAEIAQLVRDQQAVLYGVTDGVMGLGSDGVITVRNKAARQMLGLPHRTELADVVGRHYAAAGLNERLVTAIRQRERTPVRLEVGQTSLIARINDVVRDGVDLGQVILLRDVTVVEALGTKLDAVQDMADALRAQRHEFANRMHAVLGLLHQAGSTRPATTCVRSPTRGRPLSRFRGWKPSATPTWPRSLRPRGSAPTKWESSCASPRTQCSTRRSPVPTTPRTSPRSLEICLIMHLLLH